MNHDDFKKKIEYITDRYSEKTAITYMTENGTDVIFSFKDVYNIILETQSVLQKSGVVCGDRAAIITPHSPYGVMAGLALAYSNVTAVMIDASLPIEEICRLLEFSDVRVLFTTKDLYSKIPPELTQNIPCFELGRDNTVNKFIEGSIKTVSMPETADKDTDVISIIFSSGTTDKMKGIMVTYHSVIRARDVFADLAGLEDYMTYLLVLPFNHIAGFTGAMTYFLSGCKLGFIENVNSTKLAEGLKKFQPYYFAMIPKVYEVIEQKIRTQINNKGKATEIFVYSLMKLSGFMRKHFGINIGRKIFKKITSAAFGKNIFGIGTGASPCKASTTRFFLDLGLEWANLYATTETSVPITATGVHDKYPVGTVGNVNRHNGIKIHIENPDKNGIGEIYVKSDLIMKGYFREPELTMKAFENGYFKTGDYGFIDKKGYLYITGRIKESIILKSGKKVSPTDVDSYYNSRLNGIFLASCGIETVDGYDEIHMYVQNENYSELQQKNIYDELTLLSNSAPQMYHLSEIHFIDKIPMTSIGKVKRFMLKNNYSNKIENNYALINTSADRNGIIEIFKKHCKDCVITEQSNLTNDLGIDSLTMFEIVCDIDETFNKDISGMIYNSKTVKDIINIVFDSDILTKENLDIKKYPVCKNKRMLKSLKLWIKILSFPYKFEVNGLENIPQNYNMIICANHASFLDSIWILNAMSGKIDLNKIAGMAAYERLNGRFSNKLFNLLGEIPVDRNGNTIPAMQRAKDCLLNENYSIIIFPEGARSRDGSMLPFKNGAAKLAIETNKDILPIYIEGSFNIFPRHKNFPSLFDWKHFKKYTISIDFGKPITPIGYQVNHLTEKIYNSICLIKSFDKVNDNYETQIINLLKRFCSTNEITKTSFIKEDLGVDSLTMFDICSQIEGTLNINIFDKLGSVSTVEDLIKLTQSANGNIKTMTYNINDYPIQKTNKDIRRLNLFGKLSKSLYDVKVFGMENISNTENYILCPNHESHFDGMWIWTAISPAVDFNKICCLAKQEHLEHLITKVGLAMVGGIPVDRTGNTAPAIERALQCLKNDKCLMLIHPEGTRTRTGKLGEFKQGAAKLSIESGVKIIPVCISGAYEIFPPGRRLPRLFDWKHFCKYPLKIQFGTPIEPNGKNAAEITEEIRRQIVEMKQKHNKKE